jgi:hypothetical protein
MTGPKRSKVWATRFECSANGKAAPRASGRQSRRVARPYSCLNASKPLDWAKTYAYLGSALMSLSARERRSAPFEEAAAAYRAALEELTRERVPLDWAVAQNNLGFVLLTLGKRETGQRGSRRRSRSTARRWRKTRASGFR